MVAEIRIYHQVHPVTVVTNMARAAKCIMTPLNNQNIPIPAFLFPPCFRTVNEGMKFPA